MTEQSNYKKLPKAVQDLLLKSLNSIKFGTITLIIQNGKIIQVESNEKVRLIDKN